MKSRKYIISVGEPWNFESGDGRNIVKGTILKEESNRCLIFRSDHLLEFGDTKGCILILHPRFKDGDFYDLKNRIDINGGLLLREYNDNLSEKELEDNSKFVIIGSIKDE